MKIKPNIPIAVQASNLLRKQLRQAHFENNRLPGEHVIAADLGISRGSVRHALAILEQEGVISRYQGSGTFINPHVLQINARVDVAYEFSELIAASGFEPSIDTVEVRTIQANDELAARLNLPLAAPLLVIGKVFLADSQPAIYVIEHLPQSLIREAFEHAELERPIFEFLRERCAVQVETIVSELVPALVDSELATRLSMQTGLPILQFNEVFYSQANQPLLFANVFFRDEIIRFHALRKMSHMR